MFRSEMRRPVKAFVGKVCVSGDIQRRKAPRIWSVRLATTPALRAYGMCVCVVDATLNCWLNWLAEIFRYTCSSNFIVAHRKHQQRNSPEEWCVYGGSANMFEPVCDITEFIFERIASVCDILSTVVLRI